MTVHLVGAGPGDPGLITARGLDLIRRCDALVYDRLVAPELVDEAPADAFRVGREPLTQDEINEVLVALGRQGLGVVRLKGGDPFVFGRGGEEALALADAGVPFEIVPGVSSIASVPASAGIPVTHRGIASQVTALTAHTGALDYAQLARTPGTLVVFMGLGRLADLAGGLVAHGRDRATPAAVISDGSLPTQRTVVATLATIADAAHDVEPPALIVVGEVVGLGSRLAAAAPPAATAARAID